MSQERSVQESAVLARHRPVLLAWFRRRLSDAHTAEDLCQETLTRFLARAPQLDDPEKARPYLFRTARNLLVDHFRRRRDVTSLDALDAESDEDGLAVTGQAEAEVYGSEITARLRALLASLPPDQRDAFELGVVQRLPYAHVARIKGWSVGKVKVDVFRARKALCQGLEAFRPA